MEVFQCDLSDRTLFQLLIEAVKNWGSGRSVGRMCFMIDRSLFDALILCTVGWTCLSNIVEI